MKIVWRMAFLLMVIVLITGCAQGAVVNSSSSEPLKVGSESNNTVDTETASSKPASIVSSSNEFSENPEKSVSSTVSVSSEACEETDTNVPADEQPDLIDEPVDETESSDTSLSQNSKAETSVTFKVMDSAGNPIEDVFLFVNQGKPNGVMAHYTDKDGITTANFKNSGLGEFTVDIMENYKINKTVRHNIVVEELPAEFTLIWDYGNPAEMEYIPKSTATIYFKDKDGNPVTGHRIFATNFETPNEDGFTFEMLLELGVLDKNGAIVWNDPPKDITVKLHTSDNGKEKTYDLKMSSSMGNTDYHLDW